MHSFEIDGHKALGFDTGLNARAFAQAKLAQFITEPGLIVRPAQAPPSRVALWKASGVREISGGGGEPTMVVWGPPVEGERLDALLAAPLNDSEQRDKALAAISLWIQAVLALGEDTPPGGAPPPLWPSAAIIAQGGENNPPEVFFAPPSLARRSVSAADESYVNPGLSAGAEGAAFTAAAMLYRIFAGTPPFSETDISTLHQDMRDGNFLPIRLAVPGLDPRLASLIQAALDPPVTNEAVPAAVCDLGEFLDVIQIDGKTVSAASLIQDLSETERLLLEKEKDQFLKVNTVSVKTRRFVARNAALLLGCLAAVVIAMLAAYSVVQSRAQRPSTAGMDPVQVIESYYRSFGELDHQMMAACVTGDAGKGDITMVINLFVVSKTRQAYEQSTRSLIFPAHEWQGGDLPDTPLFGATDLRIKWLGGDTDNDRLHCRVDYTFWIPAQAVEETAAESTAENPLSLSYPRRDFITLVLKKGDWHIADIVRE
jgi:hypothetical protein